LYQDAQGVPLGFAGDLPKVLAAYQSRDKSVAGTTANDKKLACFWVSKAEIAANKYDLSINRYKETVHTEEVYDSPKEILTQWMAVVDEIQDELKELEQML
jgi:type I restriction enzyme M protein